VGCGPRGCRCNTEAREVELPLPAARWDQMQIEREDEDWMSTAPTTDESMMSSSLTARVFEMMFTECGDLLLLLERDMTSSFLSLIVAISTLYFLTEIPISIGADRFLIKIALEQKSVSTQ
jgi:hypothetical protein